MMVSLFPPGATTTSVGDCPFQGALNTVRFPACSTYSQHHHDRYQKQISNLSLKNDDAIDFPRSYTTDERLA